MTNRQLDIQKLLRKIKEEKKLKRIKPTPPRYDEVYFKGMEWLNSL